MPSVSNPSDMTIMMDKSIQVPRYGFKFCFKYCPSRWQNIRQFSKKPSTSNPSDITILVDKMYKNTLPTQPPTLPTIIPQIETFN